MGPDRTNYEIWLIDYLDGTLDDERVAILFAFLDENPDIKEEFSDITSLQVKPASARLRNRDDLKKVPSEITDQQFELMCVASFESDLSNDQKAELNEILSASPEKRKTHDFIQQLRLIAPDIKFRYKYRLRKLTKGQRIFRYTLTAISAAAAVLILITVMSKPMVVRPVNQITEITRDTSAQFQEKTIQAPPTGKTAQATERREKMAVSSDTGASLQKKNHVAKVAMSEEKQSEDPVSVKMERMSVSKIGISENSFSGLPPDTRLAEMKVTPVDQASDTEDTGPGQIISKFFREKILKSQNKDKAAPEAYNIADAGITKLNKLFGWEMSLQKNKDEKGEIKSVRFSSKLVSFNAPVKKGNQLP